MAPEPQDRPAPPEPSRDPVYIASVHCGRCGWPNACRVQQGMRMLQLLCSWCNERCVAIVDPTLKQMIIM